jgi:3-deoxy-D-manno-octulosonic-acid transferase
MNIAYWIYRFTTSALFILLLPIVLFRVLSPEHFKGISQRLGKYPADLLKGFSSKKRKVWVHASSVGEAGAAISIVNSLVSSYPEAMVIFSTTTRHGKAIAKKQLHGKISGCIYAPLDFMYAIRKALNSFKPDIIVFFETEIWPNWLYEANRKGIKTVMVNGRISVNSINNYKKIRFLTRTVLSKMDAFSMISEEDADRICSIGAPRERVKVNGNAKYDPLIKRAVPGVKEKIMNLFNFTPDEEVFIAGSTRTSEEEIVLDVYQKIRNHFPDIKLVIAPRHVERAHLIETIIRDRGISCQLRTELDGKKKIRNAPVVIINTIGELQDVYSVATVVFCGGSLVPKGGHNVLEAGVWGKPVLFGPSMEDFRDAGKLLVKSGGGIQIQSSREMTDAIIDLLQDPEKLERMGKAARQTVLSNMGSAEKHADVIRTVLGT